MEKEPFVNDTECSIEPPAQPSPGQEADTYDGQGDFFTEEWRDVPFGD